MDNMALPKGLLIRANGYYFQARIPKQYLSHYPKATIYEKLFTDNRKDAIRLVYARWAKLHDEFNRIDASGNKANTTISIEDMQHIVDKMVHSKIAGDGSMRSKGYHQDPNYKARALSQLSDNEEAVRYSISQGNFDGIEQSAISWLKGHGYHLETNSSLFRTFAELFAEGLAKVNLAIRDRESGKVVIEPKQPPLIKASNLSASNDIDSLEKLRDYWLTQGKLSRTAKAEAETMIKKFRSLVGDLKPSEIKKKHIVELKDKMLEAGSAPATINKGRGILAAVFSCAEKNAKIDTNPFNGMEKLKVPKRETDSPYSIQELQVIFNSDIFTKGLRPRQGKGEAAYWMPLLGLYTACRVSEVAQIFTDDIGVEDDIYYILIKPEQATGRTLKDSNKRRVPIHPDLVKMGFLDYAVKMKSESQTQLFPELKVTRTDGKLADKWRSWWSSYVRTELNITRVPQPFHGLRHSFTEHGRRCGMNYESRMRIEGHSMNTVGDKSYGNALFPLEPLYEELQKLTFKGLDLSHLYKK